MSASASSAAGTTARCPGWKAGKYPRTCMGLGPGEQGLAEAAQPAAGAHTSHHGLSACCAWGCAPAPCRQDHGAPEREPGAGQALHPGRVQRGIQWSVFPRHLSCAGSAGAAPTSTTPDTPRSPACAEQRRNELFRLVQRLLQADVAAHPDDSAAAGACPGRRSRSWRSGAVHRQPTCALSCALVRRRRRRALLAGGAARGRGQH